MDKHTDVDDVGPKEMMVPVDMASLGGDVDDLETLFEKVGPKGVAEAFLKAQDNFEEKKKYMPEGTAPAPMTAWEWLAVEVQAVDAMIAKQALAPRGQPQISCLGSPRPAARTR